MLEFTKVFPKGTRVIISSTEEIMKCKNIEFDHVCWSTDIFKNFELVCHITDNIVDVNVIEYEINRCLSHTLLGNIINYSKHDDICIEYVLNNGHINSETFDSLDECGEYSQHRHLVEYLTKISLNRFTRFYNIDKYYDTATIMLLIIKTQQRLPSAIIKHLILPFVYQ